MVHYRSIPAQVQRRMIWLWLCVFVLVIGVGAAVIFFFLHRYDVFPGGMPSTYNAVDYDWFLTRKAKTALPVIHSIDRYYSAHGIFPSSAMDLRDDFRPGVVIPTSNINGWNYQLAANKAGYRISLRVGWDAVLEYRLSGNSNGQWAFVPGDGNMPKPIKLSP